VQDEKAFEPPSSVGARLRLSLCLISDELMIDQEEA